MGIVDKATIHEYWTTDSLDETPTFPAVMSRNRFQQILHCFHVADNKDAASLDRLYKVRPLLNHFHDAMVTLYYPGKHICIDESLMPFKGRVAWKQYLKKTHCKFGIKFFVLCDSLTGIMFRTILYCGKLDDMAGQGLTSRIVLNLCADLLNNGHSLYMDNYYNSVRLAEHLLENGTYVTGTMRAITVKAACPPVHNKTYTKADQGSIIARVTNNGEIEVSKWQDTRSVLMISTEYPAKLVRVQVKQFTSWKNKKADAAKTKYKMKPACIPIYNKYMGGIDRSDQMQSYYTALRRNYSWAKKVIIHIIDMMLYNTYIIYKTHAPESTLKSKTLKQFHKAVTRWLLGAPDTRKQGSLRRERLLTPEPEEPAVFITCHRPTRIGRQRKGPNMQAYPLQRVCVYCAKKQQKKKKTTYQCAKCPDKPALCAVPCFSLYHFAKHISSPALRNASDEERIAAVQVHDDASDREVDELEDDGAAEEQSFPLASELSMRRRTGESSRLAEEDEGGADEEPAHDASVARGATAARQSDYMYDWDTDDDDSYTLLSRRRPLHR